jgi:hypothetical protein
MVGWGFRRWLGWGLDDDSRRFVIKLRIKTAVMYFDSANDAQFSGIVIILCFPFCCFSECNSLASTELLLLLSISSLFSRAVR